MADPASTDTHLLRTCENCAHSKLRCIKKEGSAACERCTRLQKDCFFREARRRQYRSKRDERIEHLEAKINQLLDQGGHPPQSQALVLNQPKGSSQSQGSLNDTQSPSDRTSSFSDPSSDAFTKDPIDAGLLSLEQAGAYLHAFRTEMVLQFPFVIIPPTTTVEQLRYEKPFLFLAILSAASSNDVFLQRKLGKLARQNISNRLVLGNDFSLELLQGLIVYLAWAQFQSRPHRFSPLIQLAISIVNERNFHHPPNFCCPRPGVDFLPTPDNHHVEPSLRAWSHEEQRAVVGCYFISSSLSVMFRKMPTFPFTDHIENYAKSLASEREYPTDQYIPALLQLQNLMERISQLPFVSQPRAGSAPLSSLHNQVEVLRVELENYGQALPFDIRENFAVLGSYQTVDLYLHRICLLDEYAHSIDTSQSPEKATDIVFDGFNTSKSLLENYFSLPLGIEAYLTNIQWIQIGFALVALTKCFTVAANKLANSETMVLLPSTDVSHILEGLIGRIEKLITSGVDEDGERDSFHFTVMRTRGLQRWLREHCPVPALLVEGNDFSDSAMDLGMNQTSGLLLDDSLGVNIDGHFLYSTNDPSLASHEHDVGNIMEDWDSTFPIFPF